MGEYVACLAQIADNLSQPGAMGRLNQVCERWIYSTCLCFTLDLRGTGAEQVSLSILQLSNRVQPESGVFEVGGYMEQVFQARLTAAVRRLTSRQSGRSWDTRPPRYRERESGRPNWEVAVESPMYDLTIFKALGKLTLKIYTKGERVLRIEAICLQHPGTGLWAISGEGSRDRFPFEKHPWSAL